MATAPTSLKPTSLLLRRRTVILVVLGPLLLFFFAIGAGIYWKARRALPQLDGSIAVPGLSAPVRVVRDAQGVPHIAAATLDDLFFAQGYVTAQDRLWQMDAGRRYAAGELAEVLGPALLKHDVIQRYLQIRNTAQRGVAALDPRDRKFLEDYARGVNAYMESHRDRLPLEFVLLHYQPKPWQLADSLMVGANMSQMLNTQFEVELSREKIVRQLDPQLVADLYPQRSWRDHPPQTYANSIDWEPSSSNAEEEDDGEEGPQDAVAGLFRRERLQADCEACRPGSNNWVVSGAHTVSGKPLLSNDMHLDHSIPNIWYEAHLQSGGYNVAGVTLPGLPFVIVGHNQRIAWGFTNLGPDVQDLFIENFNAQNQVQTPRGFADPEHRHEVVLVKGRPEVKLDVVVTRHGPIITPLLPGERRQLALQWTLYDPAYLAIPFFDVNSAGNWQEFRAAFSKFGGPSQNVVYGDVDGHIGYQATGHIPIRASGDGLLPVSGADAAHDWTGYVPFEKLPSVYDPPSGVLATANSRITPDGYPYLLSNNWLAPYRTERIYHVLENGQKFTPANMLALQSDIYSEIDHSFADHFVYAIDRSRKASRRLRQAAEIMRRWDGRMTTDSAAPSIEFFARQRLLRMLLQPKLGENVKYYSWGMSTVALEEIVEHRLARWLPKEFNNYDELLAAAVEKTIEDAPRELRKWRWGDVSTVEIQHPVLGSVPVLKWFSGTGKHPQSGGGYTVKQVGQKLGPSERLTVDFSNLDGSTLNIVVGESGNFLSPYYKDQFAAWYSGKTFLLAFGPSSVQQAKRHELTLTPAK
ncbi:MAG TPA: penicillin acylase family protein [Terriglobales bacterium]